MPNYPLPNPQLPFGQQPVSPVGVPAMLNGLQTVGNMGFQAAQVQALQQQRQVQMAQAQAQMKQVQAQILKDALTTAHGDFETLSKINPDMAIDYYHQKIAPLQDEFWGQYGVKMDSSQIPASHNNEDVLKQANQLTDLALNDPSKVPLALAGLSKLNSQMNVGDLVKEKLGSLATAVKGVQDYNQHLDQLEQDFANQINVTKGRTGGYGMQDQKVDQAIHLRQLVNQYYDPKTDSYNVPQAQYTELALGLANLLSPTGTATENVIKNIESMTAKGNLAKAVQYLTGQPQTGNTQAIIKNLVDSIDRQGTTSQKLRDNYLTQIQPPANLPVDRAMRQIQKGRGSNYADYLPQPQSGGPKQAGTPQAYLQSIGAKITPANLKWAEQKLGATGGK